MALDRSGAKAGQDVVLSIYFANNGTPTDVYDLGDVEIYDTNENLIETIDSSAIINVDGVNGLYRVIYTVPTTAEVGGWKDVWKNIKYTPIAENVDTTQFFFVVPDDQSTPGSSTTIVQMYAKYMNGTAKEGIVGYAELIDPPYYVGGTYFANPTGRGIKATSDSTGLIQWTVPQSARIRFWVDELDMKIEKVAPSDGNTANLYSLEDI